MASFAAPKGKIVMNFDVDFDAAMTATPPERQTRRPEVDEDPFIAGEIVLPEGTDIRPTTLSLVPYEIRVKELVAKAKELEVNDAQTQKEATALANTAKKLRLKVKRIEESPPFLAAQTFIKDIRHLTKMLTEPLHTQVEAVCKDKLSAYSRQLELAQKRREAEARERARVLQAELDAEAEKLRKEAEAKVKAAEKELADSQGTLSPAEAAILEQTIEEEREAAASIVAPTVVVESQAPEKVVRTEAGASFTTHRWKAILINIDQVDRKYMVVDMKAVQRDVDGGMRNIDGFSIEEITGTSLRG